MGETLINIQDRDTLKSWVGSTQDAGKDIYWRSESVGHKGRKFKTMRESLDADKLAATTETLENLKKLYRNVDSEHKAYKKKTNTFVRIILFILGFNELPRYIKLQNKIFETYQAIYAKTLEKAKERTEENIERINSKLIETKSASPNIEAKRKEIEEVSALLPKFYEFNHKKRSDVTEKERKDLSKEFYDFCDKYRIIKSSVTNFADAERAVQSILNKLTVEFTRMQEQDATMKKKMVRMQEDLDMEQDILSIMNANNNKQ